MKGSQNYKVPSDNVPHLPSTNIQKKVARWKYLRKMRELNTLAGEVDALHDGGDDPAGVGEDEGQEQVGVDFVS